MIDWDARTVSFPSPGWTIAFCEGDGPFLCVSRGDEHVGSVELLRTPIDRHAVISEALGRGDSEIEALRAAASDFVAALSADRRIGLGEAYQVRADPPTAVTVMGRQGVQLVVQSGFADKISERVVHYYVIQGDSLYLFAATGMTGGGRLGEFAIDELLAFEPVFGELAAASRVSPSTPQARNRPSTQPSP